MTHTDLIVIDRPIILARNLVGNNKKGYDLLCRLDGYEHRFRKDTHDVCSENDFNMFARRVLGTFGSVINRRPVAYVDDVAKRLLTIPDDDIYKIVYALNLFKIKNGEYTCYMASVKNYETWINMARENDGSIHSRPKILIEKHQRYYRSLSPQCKSLLVAREMLCNGNWDAVVAKYGDIASKAIERMKKYEKENRVDLGVYALHKCH